MTKSGSGRKRLVLLTVGALALVIGMGAHLAQSASAQGGDRPMELGQPGHCDGIDRDALLAEALGITVDELRAAQDKAKRAVIDLMKDNGRITEEQADLMLAQLAVRPYVDRDKLTAEALGMTVEELAAARAAGQSLRDIMDDKGIDEATFGENLAAARDKAIDQAVADGVVTAEQAAALKAAEPAGPGIGGGPRGGRGGIGGPGAPGGRGARVAPPDSGDASAADEPAGADMDLSAPAAADEA